MEISTRPARVCILSIRSDMITWSRRCTWLSNGLCTDSVTRKTRKCNSMKMSATRCGQTTNPDVDESYLIPSCIIWDTLWDERREANVNVWLTFLLPILLASFLLVFLTTIRVSVYQLERGQRRKKEGGGGGRRMTWPVDWRGGKENGHFTFSDHSQKETASN